MARGGRRPGAGRPALPLELLKRQDLADRRALVGLRPPCNSNTAQLESPQVLGDGGDGREASFNDCFLGPLPPCKELP